MGIGNILARVVFSYVFVLILLRLSGKRTLSRSTSFDLVLALILGDLFDDLFWAEVPASQFVAAAGTLVLLQLAVGLGSRASERFARLVECQPVTLVRDGALQTASLRRERMNEEDLAAMLRQYGQLDRDSWPEVAQANLEPDGELSVIKQEWARVAQQQDAERLGKARE